MKTFDFIKLQKSNTKYKKYDAILKNKANGKLFIVPFGDKRYSQYKDNTPLNLYSRLNHNDELRNERYIKRHIGFIKPLYYSAGFFSIKYLWQY